LGTSPQPSGHAQGIFSTRSDVAGEARFFKTEDGGDSWMGIEKGITAQRIYTVEKWGETLYAGTQDGLHRKIGDTGEWEQLLFTGSLYDIAIDPANPGKMLVAGGHYIALSEDGGESWEYIITSPQMAPGESKGDSLYPSHIDRFSSLAINPNDSMVIYGAAAAMFSGNDGGVIRSTDGGYTWEIISEDYFPNTPVNTLAMDPQNPDTLYAGIGAFFRHEVAGGIWKSIDGGESWEDISNGLPVRCVMSIIINPTNPQTLYAAIGKEVYRSTDGGDSWQKLELQAGGLTCLALDPDNPEIIYAAGLGKLSFSIIYRSTDSGDSWEEYCAINYEVNDILVGSLYAATNGGLWRLVPAEGETILAATSWGLIGGIIGGVAVIGMVIYFVVFRRRAQISK